MDETANEIEAPIDRTRERLGSNLRELEDKVEAATDWREHFRERPHLFLGAAFVGSMLVATAVGNRPLARDRADGEVRRAVGRNGSSQALDLWNNVQGALSASRVRGSKCTSANWCPALTSTIAVPSNAQQRWIRQ